MARARILGPRAARPLDGTWEIAALGPGLATEPGDLDALRPQWLTCDGPVPVAAALRAARQWDLEHPRDFDADDWWYRGRFIWSNRSGAARLRFEGLATVADAWLNGHHILRSESMFVAHVVDVAPLLRNDNELVLRCHALTPLLAARRPRPRWRSSLVAHQALRWHRTSLVGRMPAWCPPVAAVGPWRPILIETSPLGLEHADVRAELCGGTAGGGLVRVSLRASCTPGAATSGRLTIGALEAPAVIERLSERECIIRSELRVPSPDAWWPHTHGAQPLYDARLFLAGDDPEAIDLGRVGFRTIDVDRDADGEGFGLVVNGVPVFCRGACWTPLDLATLSADPASYRTALEQLRDAGMNMVRIGGTMAYKTDRFHDLCDELGILAWQDFMFARMDYPWDDETFAAAASLEALQIVESLQSRPSTVVFCGGSETDQQAAMLGLPASQRANRGSAVRLGELVQKAGMVWLEASPTGGTFPFQVDSGVSHYYGVGAYRRGFDDARRAGVRFAAECLAFSNVPDARTVDMVLNDGDRPGHHPRWKARVPRDAGSGWDFEDVRDHYLERLFGVRPDDLRARDPERYLALGRVATGEAMLRTFAEWRRPGATCRGGLVWLARDLWPGAGWGVIDSVGRPKAAYWYLKRVLAPVALLSADEGLNGLWLHAVNDTADDLELELRVALYRDGTERGQPARTMLTVPARGTRSVHADALFDGFLDLTCAYQFGPPGHDVVASTLRDSATGALRAAAYHFPGPLPSTHSPDLGLTARAEPTADGYEVLLRTDRFAHAVAIDVEGHFPDDNYLHLEPGETRRVGLRTTTRGAVPRGSVSALNGRGSAPIVVGEAVNAR